MTRDSLFNIPLINILIDIIITEKTREETSNKKKDTSLERKLDNDKKVLFC